MKKFFWSKQPDGRPRFGFGIYAVVFGGLFALILYSLKSDNTTKEKIVGRGVELGAVSDSVRNVSGVKEERSTSDLKSERDLKGVSGLADAVQAEKDRQKVEDAPVNVFANALDAASAEALKEPEKERPVLANDTSLPGSESDGLIGAPPSGSGGWNPLAPNQGEGRSGGSFEGSSANTIQAAIVYRRAKAPPTETTPAKPPQEEKFAPGTFLPRGFPMELYLLDTVRTDNEQPLVKFAVAKDVKFRGKVYLPFGTRLLGSSDGSPSKGQRIGFTLTSIQFPDGTELPISGVVKGLDGASGLPAYYIPPPLWTEFSGYVNDFIAGYLNLLQAHQQNNLALRIGQVNVGVQPSVFDPKTEALAATSEVIQKFASKQLDELQARNAPYLITPPGTVARFELLAPLSFHDRGVGVANPSVLPEIPSLPNMPDLSTLMPKGAQGKALQQAIANAANGMTR